MPRPQRTRTSAARLPATLAPVGLALTVLTVLAVLAGCTSDDAAGDEAEQPPSSPTSGTPSDGPGTTPSTTSPSSEPPASSTQATTTPPSTEPSAAPEPSASPEPTAAPTARPGADNSPAGRALRALIPKAALPGFNETWVWDRARTTAGPGRTPPGVCLQSSLTAIGGYAEARRSYGSSLSDDADATVVGVVFPDSQTARTATAVLSAWQQRCARHAREQLGLEDVRVTATETTSTRVGAATHWLVTYRPAPGPDSHWFDAEGFVVDRDTLTYAVIRVAGQDYNYPPGRSPVERALRVAGSRLQRTR